LLTGSYDGTLLVWDCSMPNLPQISVHRAAGLRALAISPTGLQIAWVLADKSIRIYDIREDAELILVQTFSGHSSMVNAVAYFPNTPSQIVSGAEDGTVSTWNISSGKALVDPFAAHEGSTLAVAVTPDGSCIVSAGQDGTVRLWNAKTGEALLSYFTGHAGLIHAIHISRDGSQIISGSRDGTIRIWDRMSGEQLCPPLRGHKGAVLALAVSTNEKLLVSGSADKSVALWNVDFTRKMMRPEVSEHKMIGSRSVCAIDEEGTTGEGIVIDSDGWLTRDGHKLLWVPPPSRKGLCIPPQTGILGVSDLYLDFRKFVHGKEWARCHKKIEEVAD
ncbi:WD40-repeat-containing domain protein, partial [Amylostereum chailletii]